MDLSAPSWDLFVGLFLLISVGYGFLMQRERIVVTIMAAYAGLAISQLLWPQILGFFQGDNPLLGKYFINAHVSETQVQVGLFLLTMILISDKGGLDAERGRGWLSPFELLIFSILAGGLIASVVIGYLPEANQQTLAEQSSLIGTLVRYHTLAIIAPAAALVGFGFRDHRNRE